MCAIHMNETHPSLISYKELSFQAPPQKAEDTSKDATLFGYMRTFNFPFCRIQVVGAIAYIFH